MEIKKGFRFLHSRYLDPSKLPEKVNALFEVTKIAMGQVYYCPIYNLGNGEFKGKTKDYCPIADFPKYILKENK